MPTLTKLLTQLSDKYNTSKRPLRYFDVRKRGELTSSEVRYVKRRFKELVDREACVERDSTDPTCYEKVKTDLKPRTAKRKSSFLKDYERIYRKKKMTTDQYLKSKGMRGSKSAPKGLVRIAEETGLPLKSLKEVYDIGIGAYASSGSRTGMSAEQWGYGRVYAFIMCYFHNEDGRYNDARFFKNKTDFSIFEDIVEDMAI